MGQSASILQKWMRRCTMDSDWKYGKCCEDSDRGIYDGCDTGRRKRSATVVHL